MIEIEPKQVAALQAVAEVQDGMLVGLGTGSTAAYFIDGLGERVREGLQIQAVATSRASEAQARTYGIEVLEHIQREIDLTVDGADEIDPALNLVKGLGGALLREKVVAAASRRMIVIATEDKLVKWLGRGPLPVEVLPLLWEHTASRLNALGLRTEPRQADSVPFVTDNGNLILDCRFEGPRDIDELAAELDMLPGVIGHGLFLGMATLAFIGGPSGVRSVGPAGF